MRFFSFIRQLIVIVLIFGYNSFAFAQPGQVILSPIEDTRVGGSSFGSGEGRLTGSSPLLPAPGMGARGIFSEPSYSGLEYQVHILGEVGRPGTYRVTASKRLSEAIEMAGGIPERGSERWIEVRRKGGGKRKVDLLSFKLFGNLDSNPYLLDNDVIFVPLREKVVQIAGAVKRPGTYELKDEKTVDDMVSLAGGFTPGIGNPVPIKVVRFVQGKKEVIDVENAPEARRQFSLKNADVIVIPHILTENKKFDYNLAKLPGDSGLFFPSYDERVFVLGAVTKPGPYPFNPYYDVRQYLTLAGGTTKLAKRRQTRVITAEGKSLKADAKTEINPGDAIMVPERYMAPEGVLSLVLGATASVLGITTTVLTLSR